MKEPKFDDNGFTTPVSQATNASMLNNRLNKINHQTHYQTKHSKYHKFHNVHHNHHKKTQTKPKQKTYQSQPLPTANRLMKHDEFSAVSKVIAYRLYRHNRLSYSTYKSALDAIKYNYAQHYAHTYHFDTYNHELSTAMKSLHGDKNNAQQFIKNKHGLYQRIKNYNLNLSKSTRFKMFNLQNNREQHLMNWLKKNHYQNITPESINGVIDNADKSFNQNWAQGLSQRAVQKQNNYNHRVNVIHYLRSQHPNLTDKDIWTQYQSVNKQLHNPKSNLYRDVHIMGESPINALKTQHDVQVKKAKQINAIANKYGANYSNASKIYYSQQKKALNKKLYSNQAELQEQAIDRYIRKNPFVTRDQARKNLINQAKQRQRMAQQKQQHEEQYYKQQQHVADFAKQHGITNLKVAQTEFNKLSEQKAKQELQAEKDAKAKVQKEQQARDEAKQLANMTPDQVGQLAYKYDVNLNNKIKNTKPDKKTLQMGTQALQDINLLHKDPSQMNKYKVRNAKVVANWMNLKNSKDNLIKQHNQYLLDTYNKAQQKQQQHQTAQIKAQAQSLKTDNSDLSRIATNLYYQAQDKNNLSKLTKPEIDFMNKQDIKPRHLHNSIKQRKINLYNRYQGKVNTLKDIYHQNNLAGNNIDAGYQDNLRILAERYSVLRKHPEINTDTQLKDAVHKAYPKETVTPVNNKGINYITKKYNQKRISKLNDIYKDIGSDKYGNDQNGTKQKPNDRERTSQNDQLITKNQQKALSTFKLIQSSPALVTIRSKVDQSLSRVHAKVAPWLNKHQHIHHGIDYSLNAFHKAKSYFQSRPKQFSHHGKNNGFFKDNSNPHHNVQIINAKPSNQSKHYTPKHAQQRGPQRN